MKKIKNIFLIILAVIFLYSCHTELLDPVPETFMSELSVFDTKERIEAQVLGIYSAFKSGQYLGGRFQVYNDIRGDDFINLQQNLVTGFQTWSHNLDPSSSEVITLWQTIYAAVNRINMFLEGMELNEDKILSENILTQEEYDKFIGEALALRGIAYHNLIQLFAKPYNLDPNALGAILRITAQRSSADNDKARSTVKETYDQIIQDLKDAEDLLPDVSGSNNASHITRINKSSVIAFKTRVYLHMNNWSAVISEANKLVSETAPFKPPSGIQYELNSDFEEIFSNYTTSESIFSMPMISTELPGTQNGLAHYFSAAPVGNNEYPINHESILWTSDEFTNDDIRKQLVDTLIIQGAEFIFLGKFREFPHTDWAPVMRYAEVLLNLAEAEARINGVGDASRAVALLNAVYLRSNSGADALSGFASVDDFIDRLLLERNLEFLGEGLKNMDTHRHLRDHAAKKDIEAVSPDERRYVWPISQDELNTNSLVIQN